MANPPPGGWNERAWNADDTVKELLGLPAGEDDIAVWTEYPHVSLRLEHLEALIARAQGITTEQ